MRCTHGTALLGAVCLLACGGEKAKSPPARDEPNVPVECRALQGLPAVFLVDDFEDGDVLLDRSAGLLGSWYVENDGTGRQSPAPGDGALDSLLAEPGAPNSQAHALHTSVSGFEDWGAFVGVRLNAGQRGTCTVDLAASVGLSFQARGSGDVRVNFGTPRTTPVSDGGECGADACSDFGAIVTLRSEWRGYELRFDELTQPPWAAMADWDPERAVRLSFWAEQSDLDLWLDELRFF